LARTRPPIEPPQIQWRPEAAARGACATAQPVPLATSDSLPDRSRLGDVIADRGLRGRPDSPATVEDLYAAIHEMSGPPDTNQTITLFALARDLGLNPMETYELLTMIEAEQRDVSREANEVFGEELRQLVGAEPNRSDQMWGKLRDLRERVRRRHDEELLSKFGADRLEKINEHLRNDVLAVKEDPGGDIQYSILGVGK